MAAKPTDGDQRAPIVDTSLLPLLAESLVAFAEFAADMNFSAAASRLHISQPALHAKVSKLSRILDLTLYTNDRNVLTLTPEGERLLAYTLDSARMAEGFWTSLRDESPRTMTVAAGRGSYLFVISDAIKRLSQRPGGLRLVTAQNDAAIRAVRLGVADVATIGDVVPPSDLHSVELGTYPLTLVVSRNHRLAGRSEVKVADLDGLRMALPESGVGLRDNLMAIFWANDVSVVVESEALYWDLLVRFVEFGVESTVVNSFVPLPDELVGLPVLDLPPVVYHAIWRPERQPMASELLAHFDASR